MLGSLVVALQLHPPPAVTVNDELPPEAANDSDEAEIVSGQDEVMEKLEFEMSKKMLPSASTFMRAEEVTALGTMKVCDPSLGVEAAIVIGKVSPPSVESETFTEEQFTGGRLEEAGSQETD
ncbi:MAG TPA: hypothetical protein VNO14_03840 [Blastocatellia bacterium]|nr:hypothetical protein [Blastocatellia bacterium]